MLGNETVVLKREGGRDDFDNVLTDAAPVTVEGCTVDPLDGAELNEIGRTGATGGVKVYFPMGTNVTTSHIVTRLGVDYDVQSVVVYVDDDPDLSGPVATATTGEG